MTKDIEIFPENMNIFNDKGYLWVSTHEFVEIGVGWISRELKLRLRELPQVGFLKRGTHCRVNEENEGLITLQALCVLCANSPVMESNYPGLRDVLQRLFEWSKATIIAKEAYGDDYLRTLKVA